MKLSEFQTAPVESARGFEGAQQATLMVGEEQRRAWQAGAQLAGTIGEVGMEIAHGVTRVQTNDAITNIKVAEANLKNQMAQKKAYTQKEVEDAFGGAGNVPANISALFPKDSDQLIPGFMVQGQLFAQKRKEMVDKAAEGISIDGFRDSFKKAAHADADMDIAQTQAQLLKEKDDWEIAKLSNNVDSLASVGDFDSARGMIANSAQLTAAQKEQAYAKLLHKKGEWGTQLPLRGTDMVNIDSTIAGLESNSSQFEVTDASGKKSMVDVTGLSNDERKRALSDLRSWKHGLERAAHETDKHKFDAGDAKVVDRVLDIVSRGNNLTELASLARDLAAHPEAAVSPGMRKYVIGQLTSRQNVAFTRQQTYGVTPDKSALASFNAITSQGGGEVKGPDGVSWGPLADMSNETILKYANTYGINKADQVKGMLADAKKAREGKPPDKAGLRRDIDTIVEASGLVRREAPGKATKEKMAALQLYGESMVDQENSSRADAGQPKLTDKEQKEFLQKLFSNPDLGAKVKDPNAIFFKEDAAPKFSGIPNQDLQMMAEVRQSFAANHGGTTPWSTNGPAVAAAYKRIKGYTPAIEDFLSGTKVQLSPKDKLMYGAEIDAFSTSKAADALRERLGRPPKRSEVVQEYFRIKAPGAKIADPAASRASQGESEQFTGGGP